MRMAERLATYEGWDSSGTREREESDDVEVDRKPIVDLFVRFPDPHKDRSNHGGNQDCAKSLGKRPRKINTGHALYITRRMP
jgi:hypothetical protein